MFVYYRYCVAKIALGFFIAYYGCLAFASGEPEHFKLHKVGDGIYVHQGRHVNFEHPQSDDIANIGFIVGAKCIAVVDTGGSVATGQQLLAAIRQISQLPICYVINTHIHFDHILGNLAFLDSETQFIGHTALVDAVEQNRSFFLQQFKQNLGDAPSQASIIGPDLTVNDVMDLDLGNKIIRLVAHQTAHSNTDLTVLDVQTKTLWSGDLIFKERIPVLDGKLKGWLTVLETMQYQAVDLLIPGHGMISNEWPRAYEAEVRYLKMLLSDTRKAIIAGVFLEDAVHSIGRQEKQQWLLHEQHHRRNVTKAFIELEWE